MIKTVIVDLPAIVPLLESIAVSLWDIDTPIDHPYNGRKLASVVNYLLNEKLEQEDDVILETMLTLGLDELKTNYVDELVNDILDTIGDFLIKHKLDFGICVGIVLQNVTGVVILNFGVK